MSTRAILVALSVLFAVPVAAEPQQAFDRGEMLYANHCVACHNSQLHWRDKRLVGNWKALRAEVRRWQRLSALGWNETDISQVAHYLNEHYYHFPDSY